MNVARMNHACIRFYEGGKTKVMVVGGVTESEAEEFRWKALITYNIQQDQDLVNVRHHF